MKFIQDQKKVFKFAIVINITLESAYKSIFRQILHTLKETQRKFDNNERIKSKYE